MATFGSVNNSTTLTRQFNFVRSHFAKGATAPTDVNIGTTPIIPALRFAATAEVAAAYATFPDDCDKTQNMTLELEWCITTTQSSGDTCDWTVDYVCPIENSTGNGPSKTSTQVTATTTVTTGNGLAAGDLYVTSFTINSTDTANATTSAVGIGFEIHLTDTAGVGSVDVVGAHLHYIAKY